MADTSKNTHKLSLYPLAGEYIASIDYKPPNKIQPTLDIETVVILDRSGSMGTSFNTIVTQILPLTFQKLNYDLNENIHLITFETRVEYKHLAVNDLKNLENFHSDGGTYMHLGIKKFYEVVKSLAKSGTKFLRILTISDGEVADGRETISEAEKVAEFLRNCEIAISSKAVRWFTSSYDPDTTALCCLLQLNNIQASKMLDIKSSVSVEEAASTWAGLFEDDGLFNATLMSSSSPIFRKFPWDLKALDKILLVPGKNTFWMKEVPENLKIDDRPVEVEFLESILFQDLQNLLNSKVDYIIDRMKILKIIESVQATETIDKILGYFKKIENEFPISDDYTAGDRKILKNRINLIKIRAQHKKISTVLAEIAKDNMVHKLNAAQKASYLRKTRVNKNSKNLARRSAKCTGELNFDEIAKSEALKVAEHFHEIADIDDSGHEVSFYSQATTMDGIRTLIAFTKDEAFENATVFEILELLNIVGVACKGPIGNYPDPSPWRIEKIYPSCFVSFSDILCVLNQSCLNKLLVPAYNAEITNSIPIFDDPRIGKFLKIHARSLLEFTFSIGMRQMIADVPKTVDYTLVAGVRSMMDLINENKSTKNLEIFQNMVMMLRDFAGKSDVDEYLVPQNCNKFGYFLDNSGIAEMIVTFIRAIQQNEPEVMKAVPAMLRSIYNYEVWLDVRRNYKGKEESEEIIKDMMIKLLGIDIDQHKINVEYEVPENLEFYDNFKPNFAYIKELTAQLKHLNMVALVPVYLDAAINGPLDSIKNIPIIDSNWFLKALNINYSFRNFMFLNVFQALAYTTKQDRCDTDSKTMKIIDLKNHDAAMEDVKNYVRNLFKKQYEFDLARKNQMKAIRSGNTETSDMNHERYLSQLQREPIYAKLAVEKIIKATSYNEMIEAWRNGIEWKGKNYKIIGPGYFGFRLLKLVLATFAVEIPMRSEIIKIVFFCIDKHKKEVWNHGKVNIIGQKARRHYRAGFLYECSYEDWDRLDNSHWKLMNGYT
ncbi:uncharacterized protein [Chironomus tepperi]|uniref:uncharacterized protein n=1 Tax=Chironomus tepperi TaxID=113505 RepID=UPI00391F786F